jgi:RHS repeat-associated protein
VGGASFSSASQGWDAAGRRSGLNFGSFNYSYGWQADGNLISASDSAGSGTYSYDTAGLLTNRTVGVRTTGITSRDGEGRPLSIATTVNSSSQLTESMSWGGDGLLNSDMLARADFTDSHAYSYALLSRRLIQEKLNLNASTSWTNTMVYDGGVPAGLGVLTQMGKTGSASNLWTGSTDAFSRVNFETNNTSQYPAYGHANGQATLTAWLDSQPVSVTGSGTNTMQWRATMELTPGAHQLKVSALQPSGYYTASATASFTNNRAYQTTIDGYDAAGDITNRIWRNPNGTTNRIQSLSWDARGRLQAVTDRDSNTNGYNWTAVYDGLSRRLQTVTVLVSNGVAFTSSSNVISQYYDPQVEFLELGVACNNQTEWKLYGPDLNGRYGGLNGTGGFDSDSPGGSAFNPTISDMRGNILAVVTNGVVAWNPSRLTGYGAVPGYGPVALGNGANVAQSSAWRGRWVDITGYYQIGLRPYDPVSGRWLTYDSVWNERDPNYYTFAGGEPIMGFDADGRLTSQYYGSASGSQLNLSGSGANTVSTATSPNPNQSTTSGTTDAGGQFYQAVDISIGATGAVQTGAELSSTIDNGMVYLSGLLESGSVAAKDVSSFAGDVGGPLGGIAIMWNVAGLESGNIDKTEFWINFGVTIISVSGPYGADFGVGYFAGSLVNTFVPGVAPAAQVYFQPFTDDYYGISHTVPISIGDINNDHYSTPIER